MPNIASDLPGIHGINTLHSTGKRSIPPTPKSAFLELYLRQNEKERLMKQQNRLKRQGDQVHKNIGATNKVMAGLFKTATAVMKGQENADKAGNFPEKSIILEYPK